MNAIDQRSTAELRRLRDRATNPTIRELLNAELRVRFEAHPATLLIRTGSWCDRNFIPGQP